MYMFRPQPTTRPPYDFFHVDRASLNDPWSFYEFAREQGPAYQDPHTGVFIVTGYDDAQAVFRNTEDYSNCNAVTGHAVKPPGPLEGSGQALREQIERYRRDTTSWMLAFLSYDPPVHTQFRQLIAPLFMPKQFKRVNDFIQEDIDRLTCGFIDDGRVDFKSQFAAPLPFQVVSEMFGVTAEFQELVSNYLEEARRQGAPTFIGTPQSATADTIGRFMRAVEQKFAEFIADRRANPKDDVLTAIAQGRFHDTGELASIEDLLPVIGQVYGAGTNSTGLAICNTFMLLCAYPGVQAELREQPDLIDNFIEEALRYASPSKGGFRLALNDMDIGGVRIPARSAVFLAFNAANRDPTKFPDPHTFDIHRSNARLHVGFGHGIHVCIGNHIARAEMRAAVKALLPRMANIRLSPDHPTPQPVPSFITNGPESLHLVFDK